MGKISKKIKRILHDIPLGIAFILLVGIFAIITVNLSIKTVNWATEQRTYILANYMSDMSEYQKTADGNIVYYETEESGIEYSKEDKKAITVYETIAVCGPVFWSVLCLICCALLYYLLMMREPLSVLRTAFRHIENNDLDFSVSYDGKNELAALCGSFEKMRSSLADNTSEMMAIVEQRKRLNDAYTHEMRTPIAVLRSYTDMIAAFIPEGKMSQEELLDTVQIMQHHIVRIETFIGSMNEIQKLEDLSINKEDIDADEFISVLESSADALCKSNDIRLEFQNSISENILVLDYAVVQQVFENLLGNALNYADDFIQITCLCDENIFKIIVIDNGKGFSDVELKRAGQCYYRGRASDGSYHFGLGLYISTMFCEKHGGKLEIQNAPEGGACITASFRMR